MDTRAVFLLVALASAGLGCSALEPREAVVAGGDRCASLNQRQAARAGAPRFYRYQSHVNLGDPLPRSISTRGGTGATQTWIGRANRTRRVEAAFSARILLVVLQYVLLAIGALVALLIAATWREPKARSLRLRNAVIAGAALTLALVSSYFGGSVVSVDNSSGEALDVELNGTSYALPPQSFIDLRVDGFSWDVDARVGGQTVESIRLYPDDGVGDALIRILFGHGRFVYTVCGLNSYTMQKAHYGRR